MPIPVIASGGAGSLEHFAEVFNDGCADAALAASIFHFSEHAVRDLKVMLHDRGIPVRLVNMLIPAIDLKGGKVVQLIQGEKLAIETTDLDYWIERFSGFRRVNVIDLDAAMNSGSNDHLVRDICTRLPCQVGGGVRSPERAAELCAIGAKKVIVGSALFKDGVADSASAQRFADAVGVDRVIGAVDSKGGRVVTHGWKTSTATTAVAAVRALEPFCGEFLYTHVDKEGLMKGTDIAAIRAVRDATRRPLIAAGGVTTQAEIDELDALGIDAVVGMAIYTGTLKRSSIYNLESTMAQDTHTRRGPEPPDLAERGGMKNGQPQRSDERLFMQLLVYGGCRDSRAVADALSGAGDRRRRVRRRQRPAGRRHPVADKGSEFLPRHAAAAA